jgi:hypothetical protein
VLLNWQPIQTVQGRLLSLPHLIAKRITKLLTQDTAPVRLRGQLWSTGGRIFGGTGKTLKAVCKDPTTEREFVRPRAAWVSELDLSIEAMVGEQIVAPASTGFGDPSIDLVFRSGCGGRGCRGT